MKKYLIIIFSLVILTYSAFAATTGSDSTKINLVGGVPRNSGVVVPSNVKLVGNLAIAYDYNNTGTFSYISSDTVQVVDLGVVGGVIVLRADYFGNEPEEYSCNVTFSSEGWKLQSKTASYTLPISFSIPTVDEAIKNVGVKVDTPDPGAFRLTVPVNSPINGSTVVYVSASWPEDTLLPSGDYAADIVIEVQSTK
jgi:hypothetical protein